MPGSQSHSCHTQSSPITELPFSKETYYIHTIFLRELDTLDEGQKSRDVAAEQMCFAPVYYHSLHMPAHLPLSVTRTVPAAVRHGQ